MFGKTVEHYIDGQMAQNAQNFSCHCGILYEETVRRDEFEKIAFWQTYGIYAPDFAQVQGYRKLAEDIDRNEQFSVPTPMTFEKLENMVEQYGD